MLIPAIVAASRSQPRSTAGRASSADDASSTAPTTEIGLPRVNLANFGEINWEALPKGPDGIAIAGTVNGEPITAERFRSALRKAMGRLAKSESPTHQGMQKAIADPTMEALAYEMLYAGFAEKNGLRVGESEIEEEIRTTNALLPPGQKLQDEAFAAGRSTGEIRTDIRARLIAEKVEDFVGDQFTTAPLTEEDIKPFLRTTGAMTTNTVEIRAQHIVFRATPDMSPEAIEDARARAEHVLSQIRGGRDFTEMARQNSQDRRTTKNGGDLGYFTEGKMFPEFDKVAFSLKPGEVSDVVRTPVGYHIIRVTERHNNNARSQYWQYLRAQHVLQWRTNLLRSAKIERFY